MKLKLITALIILINILVLSPELPTIVSAVAVLILTLSFFIKNSKLRTISKILLLIGSMYVLRNQFKILLVPECGVAFVLFLSALKFWELDHENDHFNMFLILFLSECSLFLINPSFLIFILGLIKMLFYFYYILKIRNYDIGLLNPTRLLILVTPSVGFALLLFYTFPRFTQGFLNTNDMQYMMSGGSSQMKFNELGPINLSREPIFKVFGLDSTDLNSKFLYWKSSVFWQISNSRISTGNINLRNYDLENTKYKYNYTVEVLQDIKEFLPVLDSPGMIYSSTLPFSSYEDGSFRLKSISRGPLEYKASSDYGKRLQTFSNLIERKSLRLNSQRIDNILEAYKVPQNLDPNDEKRFVQLKESFKSRDFKYSTTPPQYENIEDFLLNGKLGYCTHFAFSFAYLARIFNIPSRVVVGYLGGEYNPYDKSVIVRELDGHAWTEIYIQSKGWQRVDPTSFVAPERLEMSASDFNNTLDPYLSFFNLKISKNSFNFAFLNNAGLWMSSLNSKFSGSMINFNREKQLELLRSMTPKNLPIGWVFVTSLIFSLAAFSGIFYWLGRSKTNPDERRYLKFLSKMKSQGLVKTESETATHFVERCINQLPKERAYLESELNQYIKSFYK